MAKNDAALRVVPEDHEARDEVRRYSKDNRAEFLLGITHQVAALDSLEEILHTVVHIATRETGATRGTLFLNDEASGELFSQVAQGQHQFRIRIVNTSGIAGHVFTKGEGVIIHDAYQDERFDESIDKRTGFKTDSILCAPIKTVKGEVIGVIQTLNKKDGDFNEDDLELLEALTTEAANALQKSQYLEQMERSRLQELQFLDIVSSLTSEIDLQKLLQRVMGEATRMLKADRSTLFLNDEKTNELWSSVGEGLNAVEIRFPNHLGIAGSVFTSAETINIPHAYADLRFNPAFDKQTGYFTRSILCVPLQNKNGKIIGVTQVLNKKGGAFNAEDESRLKAFTSQISVGLENAKLFDEIQNIKNYNESMLESMSNGVVTLNEEGKIVTCNAAGRSILKMRETDIVGKNYKEFFGESNQWLNDKIDRVNESQDQDLVMDAEIEFSDHKVSANVTVLPLLTAEKAKLGTMIMFEDITSEKRMKSTMARYMDPSITDQLMDGDENILGGKDMVATLLFSDVRSFTTLTEALGAQGTVSLLNEYFTIMVECIQDQGGMLDKFIGDAIMAAFGTPIAHEDDEDRGLRAAVNMMKELNIWNKKRLEQGQIPIEMGIGLNTDSVVAGNIGSPKRMDYTMIGDGVNLAARLESACKQYSAKILLSEYTVKKLKGTYRLREIDKVIVKGKTQPVSVYEALDFYDEEGFPHLMDVLGHFKFGVQAYREQNWDRAIAAFSEALKANPGDQLSQTYIERAKALQANPPGTDWDGVWVMKSK